MEYPPEDCGFRYIPFRIYQVGDHMKKLSQNVFLLPNSNLPNSKQSRNVSAPSTVQNFLFV